MAKKETFFMYSITLNLQHESLAKHELKTLFKGVSVVIDSNGFSDHKSCVASCNEFFVDLARDLDVLNGDAREEKHFIAWESNPKVNPNTPHITPLEDWLNGELVKMYLTAGQQTNITRDTLKAVACGSVFTGERNVNSLN